MTRPPDKIPGEPILASEFNAVKDAAFREISGQGVLTDSTGVHIKAPIQTKRMTVMVVEVSPNFKIQKVRENNPQNPTEIVLDGSPIKAQPDFGKTVEDYEIGTLTDGPFYQARRSRGVWKVEIAGISGSTIGLAKVIGILSNNALRITLYTASQSGAPIAGITTEVFAWPGYVSNDYRVFSGQNTFMPVFTIDSIPFLLLTPKWDIRNQAPHLNYSECQIAVQ